MKCYSNKSLIQKDISFFDSFCVYDVAIVFIFYSSSYLQKSTKIIQQLNSVIQDCRQYDVSYF